MSRAWLPARNHPELCSFPTADIAIRLYLQSKAKQAVLLRQQRQVPSSDFGSLSAAGTGMPPVHLHNSMLGVNKTILAEEMPLVEPLPPYKAWDYLVRNELAQGVGRQMYYTDEIGSLWRAHLQCHNTASSSSSAHTCLASSNALAHGCTYAALTFHLA